jgi:hypothetical protein
MQGGHMGLVDDAMLKTHARTNENHVAARGTI